MDSKKTITIAITGNIFTDQRVIRIASALEKSGYKVTVFFRPYFKYKPVKKNDRSSYPFKSIQLSFLFNTGIVFYACFNIRLFFVLLFRQQDILCAVDADTLPAFTLISKLKNKPLLYDAHEYFAEVPELENKPFKQKVWHWITLKGINQSEGRYTVSESLAMALEKRYVKPFLTIRNVPLYQEKNVHSKFDIPTIIYQGALNKGRELELLIRAMKKLPGFNCVIIGEGDLSETLRLLAGNSQNIKFSGLLSPKEISTITQKAFMGFNLLDAKSKSYYYSLSNKYFDYMQAGLPSVSSFLPEYVLLNNTYRCGICIENNEEKLIKCLKYYLENEQEYLKLQQNALLASLRNNWETESLKLIEIYDCL